MLSPRTRYDISTARTGRSQVMLIQFCGYQLLGILEVVDGIELKDTGFCPAVYGPRGQPSSSAFPV